jgi:hypothetical protein
MAINTAFSPDENDGIILSTDRYSRFIVEWRTGEVPMTKKTETKMQKAEEDANLDEPLKESLPASGGQRESKRVATPSQPAEKHGKV